MNKISITKDMMESAIKRFATDASLMPEEVQIMIWASDVTLAPKYAILHHKCKDREVDFKDIMGNAVDYVSLATVGARDTENETRKVLLAAISKLSEAEGIPAKDLRIMVEQNGSLKLTLYQNTNPVRSMTFENDIF